MQVWQIAAGDGNRDYSEVFLKYGVILVGPGSEGGYFDKREAYDNPESWACRPFIRGLAEQMSRGDLVILKRPSSSKWEILAVGKVVTDYEYRTLFGDVEGWDLQHCRRMEWKRPASQVIVDGLRRGTLFGVNNPVAINQAEQIWAEGALVGTEAIPPDPEGITVDQVIDSLVDDGLPVNRAEAIANTIWRLRRLARWYASKGSQVGEHEIRTFLIVPLVISLGWAEQKIKIEWNNIDVAIFETPYRETSKPIIIIESKQLGDGLLYAPPQAEGYAKVFPSCTSFLVSDGMRYKLYRRDGEKWKYCSYMNLMQPTWKHPYNKEVEGAVSFFRSLVPGGAM